MRSYEIVFILRPDVVEEDLDKFISQMEGVVTSTGGAVQKVDKTAAPHVPAGRRRLAYEVRGHREGQYVIFTIDGGPATIREFERVLKVSEPVIKFQTVRIDEELKRLAKLKEKRDKRAGRRPKPAPPAPAAEQQQQQQPVSAATEAPQA